MLARSGARSRSSRGAKPPAPPAPERQRALALARAVLRDPLGAAVIASLLVAAVELAALDRAGAGLAMVVLALHAGLGLAIGLVLAAQERLLAWRPGLRRVAAGVHALGSVPALIMVSRHLFEGARAATLPGAALGHVWLPALGFLAVAATVAAGARLLPRLGPVAGAAVLGAGAIAVEAANRQLYTSEYADVHAFLVVVSCVLVTMALREAAGMTAAARVQPWTRWPRRAAARMALGAGVGLGLGLALAHGLADKGDRRLVATSGTHARHLARVARMAFDGDSDGAATVLGGGDCDDRDPAVHPAAADIPGNRADEDCDGRDLPLPRRAPAAVDWQARLAAWRASPEVADALARARDMNVLVVAIDTLRADALAGERAADAPHLSALLAESVHFRRAFATGAGTDLSVSSAITGRIDPFVPVDTTLAEALQAGGRGTGGVFPTEVLRYAGEVLLTRGLDRVARYVNDAGQRDVGSYTTSAAATARALATIDALRARGRPFFVWAHYFDVHEHAQVSVADRGLAARAQRYDLTSVAGKYRALVALTDEEIGHLFDELRGRGLWERTIVVLLSDHGESLGEDPRLPAQHGRFVYNALTHVPLALRIPGVAPRVVDTPVSLVDLTPTLLALCGAPEPPGLDGASLLPLFLGPAPGRQPRPIALNESEQHGVIVWPYKLLVRPADNLIELYDLAADFGETRDLAEAMPERVAALRSVQGSLPRVSLDRTRQGRKARDARARPPPRPRRGG